MNETDRAEFITEVSAAYTIIRDPDGFTYPSLFALSVDAGKARDAISAAEIASLALATIPPMAI